MWFHDAILSCLDAIVKLEDAIPDCLDSRKRPAALSRLSTLDARMPITKCRWYLLKMTIEGFG